MCDKLRWGIYLGSGTWILLFPVLLFLFFKKKKKQKETVLVILQKKNKNIMYFKPTVWLLLFQKEMNVITWDRNKGRCQMPLREWGAPRQAAMGAQIWFPEEKMWWLPHVSSVSSFLRKPEQRAGYWDGKHEIFGLQTVHRLAFRRVSEEERAPSAGENRPPEGTAAAPRTGLEASQLSLFVNNHRLVTKSCLTLQRPNRL